MSGSFSIAAREGSYPSYQDDSPGSHFDSFSSPVYHGPGLEVVDPNWVIELRGAVLCRSTFRLVFGVC